MNTVAKVLPPVGLPRQLAIQAAVVAVGWGIFLTGSVVFFKLYVGLPAVKIGIGLSIAGVVGLVAAMPAGQLADRIGGRRTWVAGSLVGTLAFVLYPFAGGFWSFVGALALQTISQSMTEAGRVVYTAAAIPREDRVRILAYVRAYLNAGFTVGGGAGAVAIALNSRLGLLILVLANAAGMVASAIFIARMPEMGAKPEPETAEKAETGKVPVSRPWGVAKDRAFLALSGLCAAMFLIDILFAQTMPLWVITRTDAPHPILGGLVALNTVVVVLFQVRAAKGAESMAGSARLTRWAAAAIAGSCLVLALTGRTHGLVTSGLLIVAVLLITGGELWSAAAGWFFMTDVPPAERRGVYTGAANTLTAVAKMAGPASLTFLAIDTGGWGWFVIAGLFVLVGAAIGPVTALVGRTPRTA